MHLMKSQSPPRIINFGEPVAVISIPFSSAVTIRSFEHLASDQNKSSYIRRVSGLLIGLINVHGYA